MQGLARGPESVTQGLSRGPESVTQGLSRGPESVAQGLARGNNRQQYRTKRVEIYSKLRADSW